MVFECQRASNIDQRSASKVDQVFRSVSGSGSSASLRDSKSTPISSADTWCSKSALLFTKSIGFRQKIWTSSIRAQSAIVDPMKAVRPAASALWTDGPTLGDADTQSLLGREQLMVSAWKDHDAGRMDRFFFGPEMQFIDIFGDHIATRAQALKAWSGEGCDVKSFEFSGAKATMFAPNFRRADLPCLIRGQVLWARRLADLGNFLLRQTWRCLDVVWRHQCAGGS
jgi:hypothetical protein